MRTTVSRKLKKIVAKNTFLKKRSSHPVNNLQFTYPKRNSSNDSPIIH